MSPQMESHDDTAEATEIRNDDALAQLLADMDSGEMKVEPVSVSETGYNLVKRC